MSAPQISVVLPVFNAQDFLEPLLDSLRHQSETSLEIIAVDDGSTDDSLAILQSAARRDPRLCVLQQLNKGISVARNTALGHARGTLDRFRRWRRLDASSNAFDLAHARRNK